MEKVRIEGIVTRRARDGTWVEIRLKGRVCKGDNKAIRIDAEHVLYKKLFGWGKRDLELIEVNKLIKGGKG